MKEAVVTVGEGRERRERKRQGKDSYTSRKEDEGDLTGSMVMNLRSDCKKMLGAPASSHPSSERVSLHTKIGTPISLGTI